jgi:hypothetical protein
MTFVNLEAPADRQVQLSQAALAVACTTCQAWPGSPCVGLGGDWPTGPHPKRMQLVDRYIRDGAAR